MRTLRRLQLGAGGTRRGSAGVQVFELRLSGGLSRSENRYPPRIKSGAGFFGIML
jgi:hypothetical protein